MRLNPRKLSERLLEKGSKFCFQKWKKTEIVNYFLKEDITRRAIYNTVNRMQLGGSSKDKMKIGRPSK